MATISFRRLFSANAASSLVGTGIQAATAPAFLLLLSVNQYASILLAQTVSSYAAFFLNGYFYFVMNSITHNSVKGQQDRARELYTLGCASILTLFVVSVTCLIIALCLISDTRSNSVLIWVASVGGAINLGYILVDANFRVRNQYTLGVNILTVARLTDFALLVATLAMTRDVLLTLVLNICTRALTMIGLKALCENHPKAIHADNKLPSLSTAVGILVAARGQLGLSAYTALSVMGPQLAVSAFFSDGIAVAFNVHRTYMRIVAALANIVTASSWPILNNLHASGQFSELSAFLSRLITRSIVATTFTSIVLYAVAPWLFPVLFHGKISANSQFLLFIGLACIFNGGTTISQALYLATNLRSAFILAVFVLTGIELALIIFVGLYAGFLLALVVYALAEFTIMIFAIIGCSQTLKLERREQTR